MKSSLENADALGLKSEGRIDRTSTWAEGEKKGEFIDGSQVCGMKVPFTGSHGGRGGAAWGGEISSWFPMCLVSVCENLKG